MKRKGALGRGKGGELKREEREICRVSEGRGLIMVGKGF